MSEITIPVVLEEGARAPEFKTSLAAGADCYAHIPADANGVFQTVCIMPGEIKLVSLGFRCAVPEGYEMQLRPRSGIALKDGITLNNSPGTIDADYRGVVGAIVINHGSAPILIKNGDRICQAVINAVPSARYVEVEDLDSTERGDGGFGHTGRK